MIPADVEALALADAIGALDADEQRELQALVATLTADGQAQVARLYDVAASLAATAPAVDPPAGARDRLLAAIAAPRPVANYTLLGSEGEWNDTPLPGIRIKVLALDKPRNMVTMLLRAQPGARYPSHRHSTCEECYVLSGSVVIEGRVLHAGDFHHAEGDSDHGEIYTTEGAEVLLVGAISDYLPGH
jgi:anti-sigma factor ChrR (cupin superfamily)